MNANVKTVGEATALLTKADPTTPCLKALGREAIAIKAGTSFNGYTFASDTTLEMPKLGLTAGRDYVILVDADGADVLPLDGVPDGNGVLGGFHFAPGDIAHARAGGDDVPAINPYSLWDLNFRPTCPDPRGMTLVEHHGRKFWCDIYLTAADHTNGTSRFGVTIADGDDLPVGTHPDGKKYKVFDYATAVEVLASHGKGLLSIEEFFAAAFGVTEKSADKDDPDMTGLDAPRTSKFGLMQATGNMWVWGHDGDPDAPRASLFGGSWTCGGSAGSRCADVDSWPEHSGDALGARGRSDHLQLG